MGQGLALGEAHVFALEAGISRRRRPGLLAAALAVAPGGPLGRTGSDEADGAAETAAFRLVRHGLPRPPLRPRPEPRSEPGRRRLRTAPRPVAAPSPGPRRTGTAARFR